MVTVITSFTSKAVLYPDFIDATLTCKPFITDTNVARFCALAPAVQTRRIITVISFLITHIAFVSIGAPAMNNRRWRNIHDASSVSTIHTLTEQGQSTVCACVLVVTQTLVSGLVGNAVSKPAVHPLTMIDDVVTQTSGKPRLADAYISLVWSVNHTASSNTRIRFTRVIVIDVTVFSGVTCFAYTLVFTSVFYTRAMRAWFRHAWMKTDVTIFAHVVLCAVTRIAVSSGRRARAMYTRIVCAHS